MKRRDFLAHGSALTLFTAMGGVRLLHADSPDQAALTSADAVLSIDTHGKVVFVSPYTEMGQGSFTAAAMMMADELDTDLASMELRHHDGMVVLTDPTFDGRFNGGGSGGSQSVASGWVGIRDIGAAARTALIETAAARWGVNAAECDTAQDCVVHEPSQRKLKYAELVAAAARRPLPDQPRYLPASRYRYIGKPQRRADTTHILTGQASYAMDGKVEGMLYASIERCPFVNGAPVAFDRDQALAVPGVIDVFRLEPGEFEIRAKCSIAVVARDTWSALQGRKALRAQWQANQPMYADEGEFWAAMEQGLHSDAVNAEHTVGDFAAVDTRQLTEVAHIYRMGYQNQTPMEPIAMTAHHRGDVLELWVGTQYPSSYRERIAEITGLRQEKIIVHNTIMGGSFGRRFVRDGLTESILIAQRVKHPVKLVWTREDDLQNGQYRNASIMNMRAWLGPDQQVHRWYQKSVQTHPQDPQRVSDLASGMSDQPYTFKAARYEILGVPGNVNLGPMRSPPHPAKLFPTVCFIDELAHRMGVDPIDLHIRLVGQPRDIPQGEWLSSYGNTDNTSTYIEVAQAVRRLSHWDEPLPTGSGKGFAMGYIFGTHVGMVVEVAWRDDMISIEKVWCAVNCGREVNPDVARQQVEGGAIYGLSSAMGEVITTIGGEVQQSNFHNYPIMRFAQAPEIVVEFIKSDERPSGLGEPVTPPAYPALANAVFAASGKRIREIPLNRHITFAPMRSFS